MAILFVVLDGLGDRPYEGKTALERAETPNIDSLLSKGRTGIMDVLEPGVPPGSDTGHWALFGYREGSPGRGVFEAYGYGIPVKKGDVVFRANMGLVEKVSDGYRVKERRRERDWSPVEKIDVDGHEVRAFPTLHHRGVVATEGSQELTDSDPGSEGKLVARILAKKKEAEKTAATVNDYMEKAYEILGGGHFLLLRGAGSLTDAPPFRKKWGLNAACVAGGPLYRGVARFLGMEIIDVKGATGDLESDFSAKFKAAVSSLKSKDFVFLHVKAPDEASHMKKPLLKAEVLERIDSAFSSISDLDATVAVTGDHTTPSTGPSHHSGDPVPLLVSGPNVIPDGTETFNEKTAARGALNRFRAHHLIQMLLDAEDKSKEVSFDLNVPPKPYFGDYEPL